MIRSSLIRSLLIRSLVVILLLPLVSCGDPPTIVTGASDVNGGLLTISTPGTYTYPPIGLHDTGLRLGLVPDPPNTQGGPVLQSGGGSENLRAGRYRGECFRGGRRVDPCTWSVTLTLQPN